MSLSIPSILSSVSSAVAPLKKAISSQAEFEQFMLALGWRFPTIPAPFSAFSSTLTAIENLYNALKDGEISSNDVTVLITNVKQIIQDINSLQGQASYFSTNYGVQQAENFTNTVFKELPDYLICDWMQREAPALFYVLKSLSLIKVSLVVTTTAARVSYTRYEIMYSDLPKIISEPDQLFANTYQWGTSNFDYRLLLNNVYMLLTAFGVRSAKLINYKEYKGYINQYALAGKPDINTLMIVLWSYFNTPVFAQFAMELGPLPEDTANNLKPGLFLTPILNGGLSTSYSLGDSNWTVSIDANLNYQDGVMVLLRPGQSVEIKNNLDNIAATTSGYFKIALTKNPAEKGSFITLFGEEGGSTLKCGNISLETGFTKELGQPGDFFAELDVVGGMLTIEAPENGFLSKIIPQEGLQIDFDFSIGYSMAKGLYFGKNSIGLTLSIPTLSLGFDSPAFSIKFYDVFVTLKVESPAISLVAATSIALKIAGVIDLEVQGIGIKNIFSFKRNNGQLGIADADINFKFPNGIKVAITTATVTGGGFLNYDEATYTYTGGLELRFSKIALAAIGILTTRMPDGSDGYSLLIIITAEFTPIQLGMGFTLNGVGGLLGLNRTINTDKLRLGVRDNTLDNILFPQDIVKNANAIISNLGQVFPVKKDRFLIGPMAKIGWGTPTLLTIELGIIIEMPSPILLAIVGVLKAILPKASNKILAIQINFVGIIDFDKKQLSFDASLYDSSILTFALTGDMALRLYWGDKPNFLLSVGGFHPRFTPPPMNLPDLRRLSIILANSNNLNVKVETYFAITSNSVQFGARVAARAKAWKIEAIGALWFDILFQFSPFHFIADMGVMFEIRKGSSCLLSIFINLTVEGPHPWRIQGKGSFKILFVKVNVSFDKTFGEAQVETIAPVAIQQQVHDAILNKDNWQVTGPDRSHQVVTFRDISAATGSAIVVDPFGGLVFGQKVAPFNIKLSKFGTSAISDFNQFSISGITTGVTPNLVSLPVSNTQDFFAPNSFFYLNDDQRLSRDSYEKYVSGATVGSTDKISSDYFVHKKIEYDEIVIDLRQRKKLIALYQLSQTDLVLHTMDNYVTRSSFSSSLSKTPLGGPDKLAVQDQTYMVADRNTLGTVGALSFRNYTEAANYVASLQNTDPNFENYMVVNSFEL